MKKLITLLSLAVSLSLSAQNHVQIPSDDGLFPFTIGYKLADGVTDFSEALDAPAGKYGFTRIENGHFVNDNGRIVFNGFNVVGGACFPSHEQAERMAKRLAHFGINMVRLHFYDLVTYRFRKISEQGILLDDGTFATLNPEQLDKFDYLVNQFKIHGIYIDINFLVGRPFKLKNAVDPVTQQLEMDFEKAMLTHVNPYTGLSLADDPCVALFELNNEDAVFYPYYIGKEAQYRGKEGYFELPIPFEELKKASPEEKIKALKTLEELDRKHWVQQKEYIVKELGVKVPVTSTQISYTSPWALKEMDFYDMHSYWCHPRNSGNADKWDIENAAMVNSERCGSLPGICSMAGLDRPYTLSECNFPFPNMYGAEGQPILHAVAAFQGWDGVIAHSYNNLPDEEIDYLPYNFTFCARTDALAHFIACSAMLLRGDVREADSQVVIPFTRKQYEDAWVANPVHRVSNHIAKFGTGERFSGAQYLMHKTRTDYEATEPGTFAEEEVPAVKLSDTGEIEWNNEMKSKGMYVIRTANTKVLSGFPAGRTVDLGDGISFSLGNTKLGWTTMSLVSRDGNGFGRKSRALLVATGYTKHSGQVFTVTKDEKGRLTNYFSSRGDDWGHGPMLTEGINGTLTLASKASRTRCWALDENGARAQQVPVGKGADGKAVITISDAYKTVWYEIEVR